MPFSKVFASTDSLATLGWLQGNPKRFLALVGNQVVEISEAIPVSCWQHVKRMDDSADASSRMLPAELVGHDMWRKEPDWLKENEENWNKRVSFDEHPIPTEERNTQKIIP